MKKCPYCGSKLNFLQFTAGYGSDTLLKHPAKAHPHEHKCLSCHRLVWIHYDPDVFARSFRQSLTLHLVFTAAMTFFWIAPALQFSPIQTVFFMLIVMLFGGVILKARARYESAVLKAEKTAP